MEIRKPNPIVTAIVIVGLIGLLALRITLRLTSFDPATGFYNPNDPLLAWFTPAYLVMLLFFLMQRPAPPMANAFSSPSPRSGIAAMILTGVILLRAAAGAFRWIAPPPGVWENPILGSILLLVSFAAAVVWAVHAWRLFHGQTLRWSGTAWFSIPILNQCMRLMEWFSGHVATRYASDILLETLVQIFGILFLIGHARWWSRLSDPAGGVDRLTHFSGRAYLLTTALLVIPGLVGWAAAGIPPPPISDLILNCAFAGYLLTCLTFQNS